MRTSEQKKLQQFIQRLIDPMLAKRGFTERRLLSNWEEVVGTHLSSQCLPIQISYPTPENRQGNLHLGVLHAYATELQHQVPILREKVNRFFGYEAIANVRFHPLPRDIIKTQSTSPLLAVPHFPIREEWQLKIAEIADEELRQNLLRLAAYIDPTPSHKDKDQDPKDNK